MNHPLTSASRSGSDWGARHPNPGTLLDPSVSHGSTCETVPGRHQAWRRAHRSFSEGQTALTIGVSGAPPILDPTDYSQLACSAVPSGQILTSPSRREPAALASRLRMSLMVRDGRPLHGPGRHRMSQVSRGFWEQSLASPNRRTSAVRSRMSSSSTGARAPRRRGGPNECHCYRESRRRSSGSPREGCEHQDGQCGAWAELIPSIISGRSSFHLPRDSVNEREATCCQENARCRLSRIQPGLKSYATLLYESQHGASEDSRLR